MTYKSLFTVLTDTDFVSDVLEQGIVTARQADAHFEVLCLGVDRSQQGYYYAGANALVLQEALNQSEEEAAEIEALAKARLERSDILWSVSSGVSQMPNLPSHIAARARFADLAIMPKPYGPKRRAEMEPALEAVLFEGDTPVLLVPESAAHDSAPKRVLIAWDESQEALRAVRLALPFLKEAHEVQVVIIDPPVHGPERSDPGGQLSLLLARHGVRAEIDVLARSLPRVSDVLLRAANDMDADMIVMGAYGHSRFREAVLGGATRHMLERADRLVFMAH